MREQSQCIDDARGNAFAQQVVEGEVGVFHHIVQKSCRFFLVRVPHQSNGERMENDGVAVAVCLFRMGSGGDAEGSVYEVHNFRNSEMSFIFFPVVRAVRLDRPARVAECRYIASRVRKGP